MILTNFGSIPSSGGGLWLEGWSYGKKITIPANSIDADLTDFPATVYLNGNNFDFSKAKYDGSDIRFTDKNLNQLKFERKEHLNGNKTLYNAGVKNIQFEFMTTSDGSSNIINSSSEQAGSVRFYMTKTDANLGNKGVIYKSVQKIDLTPLTTLSVTFSSMVLNNATTSNNFKVAVMSADPPYSNTINGGTGLLAHTSTLSDGAKTMTLDVSAVNQFAYIVLIGFVSAYPALGIDCTMTKIELNADYSANAVYNILIPTVSDLTDTEIYMWYGNANAYNTSIEAWQDQTGKQLTYNGNVKLVHGVQTGKRVASFDGSGDYFSITDSEDWTFGNGDFTVEWIENRTASVVNNSILGNCGTGGTGSYMYFGYHASGTNLNLYLSSNGTSWDIANGVLIGTYDLNIKNHFAVTRTGSTFRTFKNGIKISEFTSSATIANSSNLMRIGTEGSSTYYYTGQIYGIRIIKGRARYTSNFTPPTTFTIDGSDVVFCTNFDTIYDANYAAVHHLGANLFDASGAGNHNTAVGSTIVDTPYGVGRTFNGTSDYVKSTNTVSLAFPLQVSMLLKKGVRTNAGRIMNYNRSATTTGFAITVNGSTNPSCIAARVSNGQWDYEATSAYIPDASYPATDYNAITANMSTNATIPDLVMNGDYTLDRTTGPDTWVYGADNSFITYGVRSDLGTTFYDPTIVEVRVSNSIRPEAWIKAESLALKNSLITMTNL